MEYLKKRQTSSALFCCYVIEISTGRYIDVFKQNSSLNFQKTTKRVKKIDTCILCMTQHLMISDGVHRYLPVYCYFLISSILIEFPCNLQINTYYQGSNLFMSICTASHRPKDLLVFLFSCSSFSPELFLFYILSNLTF